VAILAKVFSTFAKIATLINEKVEENVRIRVAKKLQVIVLPLLRKIMFGKIVRKSRFYGFSFHRLKSICLIFDKGEKVLKKKCYTISKNNYLIHRLFKVLRHGKFMRVLKNRS
jgi:hypothetical protein